MAMKIKKIVSASLQEGKSRIIEELGEDAVILSSRTMKNPKDGSKVYEIVAAIDDTLLKSKESLKLPKSPQYSDKTEEEKPDAVTTHKIYEMIDEIRNEIKDISDNIKYKYSDALGEVFGKVYKQMRKSGISEEYALNIIGRIASVNINMEQAEAYRRAKELVTEHVNIEPPVSKGSQRKTACFIGTTGSGKTTTLVKLAIICKLVLEADVLIISADSQKIGATDQLQTYASIAGISFRAAESAAELKHIIDGEKSRDFIFVDTAGCSQQNKEQISDIKEITDSAQADFIYLVQTANVSAEVLKAVFPSFKRLDPTAIILSKTDEAAGIGELMDIINQSGIPLAYFTTGQKIPDDIEPASKEYIQNMIFPGEKGAKAK